MISHLKITIAIAVALMLSSAMFSCTEGTDLLDPETNTGLTEEETFSSARNAMRYLTDIYGQLLPVIPQTGNKGMRWRESDALLEVATDNASSNLATSASFFSFNAGAWSASTRTFSTDDWDLCWGGIRSCYIFLSHIDNVPLDSEYNFTESVKRHRKGEAMFLLAFHYSELMKQFGGLPLLDKAFDITDEMQIARSSFDATVDFIVNLCDEASALLPVMHDPADFGRATKGAAMALKARVLLYAASPLWNDATKPDDSPFRGKYDPEKWKKAAAAANEVIDLNVYQLHADIATQFLTRVNKEFIFTHMNQPCTYMTSISIPNRLYPPGAFGKSGCNQVTYNLIKEYEVLKDGKAYSIDDPKSGYDPNDPYKNRDPRFYRDCLFNGYKFQGKTVELGEAVPGVNVPVHNPKEQSAYYTHVYSVKFADKDLVISWDSRRPKNGVAQNYPYIRYAEVLMNYAEAMNEAFGPEVDGLHNGRTALWALNQVRTRATYPAKQEYMGLKGGMPPVESGLSRAQLREKIRKERRIEFSFEEHRFWDVRRWMLDPSTLTEIQAQVPVKQADGSFQYEIRTIEKRFFDKKMYRMPIPEDQLFANPNLVQNPGYTFSPEQAD